MLLVDSGNALFKAPGLTSAEDKARASFILKTMGQLGTQAMAAGARDLNLGPSWLKSEAEKAKVKVLSANLVDGKGKPLFPASTTVEVGGKKVGLIGVSPVGPVANGAGAKGTPAPAAIAKVARKLRPEVDLIVVLAALPYADSLQLATEVDGAVDFILQSHEARGAGVAQRGDDNFVLPSGERGRQMGRLVLGLGGKGPFVDSAELERDQQTLKILDTQLVQVAKRIEMTSEASSKKALQETQRQFQTRKKEVEARVAAGRKATGRSMALDWVTLTGEFTEDPAIAAGVRKIEPHGAGH